jgi:Zn-dependent protease
LNTDSLLAQLPEMLILAVPILWALTIHEFAHAYVAVWAGDPTPEVNGRLTLNPLAHLDLIGTLCMFFAHFGWAKPVPVNPYNFRNLRRDNVLVSIAGVTVNLAMAGVAAIMYHVLYTLHLVPLPGGEVISVPVVVHAWVLYSVILNVGLAVFNMIPIPPLDGSHVVETLVPYQYGEQWGTFQRFGPMLLLLLVFTGVTGRIMSFVVEPVVRVLLGRF